MYSYLQFLEQYLFVVFFLLLLPNLEFLVGFFSFFSFHIPLLSFLYFSEGLFKSIFVLRIIFSTFADSIRVFVLSYYCSFSFSLFRFSFEMILCLWNFRLFDVDTQKSNESRWRECLILEIVLLQTGCSLCFRYKNVMSISSSFGWSQKRFFFLCIKQTCNLVHHTWVSKLSCTKENRFLKCGVFIFTSVEA